MIVMTSSDKYAGISEVFTLSLHDALPIYPQGRYVVAAFDKDGDENWQAYAMPPAGGQLEPLLVAEGEKFYPVEDRKSTRLNSSHVKSSYAVFCLKKKT